jgi:undecaprenyl-diphosphatase
MSIFEVILLGIVQGLTEFLPISSTAHLVVIPRLFGWPDPGLAYDIALHVGTLAAVLIYFFRDWVQILAQGFGIRHGRDEELKHNHMLLWLLAIGTIPVGIAGLLFGKQAETVWRSPYVIGVMLILVGILMGYAEKVGQRVRDLSSLNLPDTLGIGLAQALAVVPGTSRSGATISAGLFRNLTREGAARFSFLLSTPAIALAAAKAVYEIHKQGGLHALLGTNFLVGVSVSALTGCAVIAWFLRYLRRSSLRPFVYYRIIFGIMVLALAFVRRPA